MKKKKKQTRRSKQKHPDLDPKYNLKTRADLIDQDYLHKLSPKELEWLNKFNKEEVNASFDLDSPRKNFNKSKSARKKCYDRNNARNRDILTRAKASNQIIELLELPETMVIDNYEEDLIEEIDLKEAKESIEWLAERLDKEESKIEKRIIETVKKK